MKGNIECSTMTVCWLETLINDLFNRFEDGTLPFLSVISLLNGFSTLDRLVPPINDTKSMTRISRHCFSLAKYLFKNLKELKYSNGQPVVKLYHDTDFESIDNQGGIVNFNLLHTNGSFIGFAEVIFQTFHTILELLKHSL